MQHYLNVCDINGADVEPVDVISMGSPCQDLSVAGKRKGLQHETKCDEETTRSGLFMEGIRIIKEMRENDRNSGRSDEFIRPRYALWENVPGAFSSNGGEDFRVVLEELARIRDSKISIPRPNGKWRTAGAIIGDGWSIAWRVLDAQYWGVPQRRRRIFLITDFGGGSAGEILFKSEGLCRNLKAGREAGEGVADIAQRSIGETGGRADNIYCVENSGDVLGIDAYNGDIKGNKVATLGVNCDISTGRDDVMLLDDQGGAVMSADERAKTAPTLRAEAHGNVPCVAYNGANITSPVNKTKLSLGDPCRTLTDDSRNYVVVGKGSAVSAMCPDRNNMQDLSCYPINTMVATRTTDEKRTTFGIGEDGDLQFTIQAGHEHGVCYSINHKGGNVEQIIEEKSGTLTAAMNSSGNNKLSVCYGISAYESNCMKSDNPHSGIYEAKTARTIDLNGGNPACNQGGIAICEPVGGVLAPAASEGNVFPSNDTATATGEPTMVEVERSMSPAIPYALA